MAKDVDRQEEQRITSTEDNMVICRITNIPKKATTQEKTLQDVIESLTEEYNFEIEDMERDFKLVYVVDPTVARKNASRPIWLFSLKGRRISRRILPASVLSRMKRRNPPIRKKAHNY